MHCERVYGRNICDAEQLANLPRGFEPIRPSSTSPPSSPSTSGSSSPALSWREAFSIDVILRPDPPSKRRRTSCSSFESESQRSDSVGSTDEHVIYRPVPLMAFRHRIPATLAYSWSRHPVTRRALPADYYRTPPAAVPIELPLPEPVAVPISLPMSFNDAVQQLREQEEQVRLARRFRPKKFACSFPGCKNTFSNRGQLNGHYRIHTGERPFKCDIGDCKKDFTRNEELTRHKRIHTNEKPYTCSQCEKAFGRRDHLRKHQRIHQRALLLQIDQHYEAMMRLFAMNNGQI